MDYWLAFLRLGHGQNVVLCSYQLFQLFHEFQFLSLSIPFLPKPANQRNQPFFVYLMAS